MGNHPGCLQTAQRRKFALVVGRTLRTLEGIATKVVEHQAVTSLVSRCRQDLHTWP